MSGGGKVNDGRMGWKEKRTRRKTEAPPPEMGHIQLQIFHYKGVFDLDRFAQQKPWHPLKCVGPTHTDCLSVFTHVKPRQSALIERGSCDHVFPLIVC